jgi:hypothetical protein
MINRSDMVISFFFLAPFEVLQPHVHGRIQVPNKLVRSLRGHRQELHLSALALPGDFHGNKPEKADEATKGVTRCVPRESARSLGLGAGDPRWVLRGAAARTFWTQLIRSVGRFHLRSAATYSGATALGLRGTHSSQNRDRERAVAGYVAVIANTST